MTINGTKKVLRWTGRHVTQKSKGRLLGRKGQRATRETRVREIRRGSTKKYG